MQSKRISAKRSLKVSVAACFFVLTISILFFALSAPEASLDNFNFNWRFAKGDHHHAAESEFDDSSWEKVHLPHDWAISGPFASPHLDDSEDGKLPWKGIAWYRKLFHLPESQKGKRLILLFDGVMSNPTVYLNGKEVGSWIYGYNSFHIDATEAANFGGTNVLAVYVDTNEHETRWYCGAGIYRKVTAQLKNPVHIPVWGIFVTTPRVSDDKAVINIQAEVTNTTKVKQSIQIESIIIDPDGQQVTTVKDSLNVHPGDTLTTHLPQAVCPSPKLWDTDHAHLYKTITRLRINGRETDQVSTSFGIRSFKLTADDGFHLNGRRVQLHGVNLHHDHGPLGVAFFPRAMERQLEIMQEMGVNAIRTSHNVPAPELLDLCDRMGIIVYNEAFDKYGKKAGVDCSYEEYAEIYAERELRNFVRRDRNHPSVFFWSVGNEVGEVDGDDVTAKLVSYVKKYDTTRYVTQGFCEDINASKTSTVLQHLDSSGWNYGAGYLPARENYPHKPIIYTESASAFGTRGAYKIDLPEDKKDYSGDGECTAFVLTSAPWSDIPEYEFDRMIEDDFVAGEFVWTGFDYLGEPVPYVSSIAKDKQGRIARSSYFGIVDLAGFPKDSYYLYRSHWRPETPTVKVSPHWNWHGHEGKGIPVFVYTNGDAAEIFINGTSQGIQHRKKPENRPALPGDYYEPVSKYRFFWPDVTYQPGELKAVAWKDGKVIGQDIVKTAGKPAKLHLSADRSTISASGMDLTYIIIEMHDTSGNLCPLAMDNLEFFVDGPAKLMGVANGNQMGFDTLTDETHPLFYGKAVGVLRSELNNPGTVTLHVKAAESNIKAQIQITVF